MKKKNGFISISIIYSFFIVFLLLMLAMLNSYTNKRYLKKELESGLPTESPCRIGDSFSDCLIRTELIKKNIKEEQLLEKVVNYDELQDGFGNDEESGMYVAPDDYVRIYGKPSYYYRGNVNDNFVVFDDYIWRVVRINGDNTIRLIYQGEYNTTAGENDSKVKIISSGNKTTDSIYIDNYGVAGNTITMTKYNYSSYTDTECNIRLNLYSFYAELGNLTENESCEWYDIACNLGSTIDDVNDWIKDKAGEAYVTNCGDPSNTYGAHLLNNIGFMNNNTALLYRYDSKYDNQDDSEVKKFLDIWYANINDNNNYLEPSTIFCGDKNRTKCDAVIGNCSEADYSGTEGIDTLITFIKDSYDKSEKYYYSGWSRIIDGGSPSFICPDTSEIATIDDNKVLNLSRYNVDNATWPLDGVSSEYALLYQNSLKKLAEGTSLTERNNMIDFSVPSQYNTNISKVKDLTFAKKLVLTGSYAVKVILKDGSSLIATLPFIGNEDLKNPIGLLSADEAIYAGMAYGADSNSYLLDYAKDEEVFWTMTLSHTDYTSLSERMGAYYFAVKNNGGDKGSLIRVNDYPISGFFENLGDSMYKSSYGAYIRPVINLKLNTKYCSGAGTASDPYIIGNGSC